MKKIFACIMMLISVCFCDIANASYIDDLAAANPQLQYKAQMRQNKFGAESMRKNLKIWRSEWVDGTTISMRLFEWGGKKLVFMDLDYHGPKWKFYKLVTIGNGESLIELRPVSKPVHEVISGGKVVEYLMLEPKVVDLEFMKNTKIIRAVIDLDGYSTTLDFKTNIDNTMPYFEAIDHAIKFLNE